MHKGVLKIAKNTHTYIYRQSDWVKRVVMYSI